MEKDLIKAVSELIPLSRTAKEQIDFLKEWASTGRGSPSIIIYLNSKYQMLRKPII